MIARLCIMNKDILVDICFSRNDRTVNRIGNSKLSGDKSGGGEPGEKP